MDISGKDKALSKFPPTPPKRPVIQGEAVHTRPVEEGEDQYTYEIPPREDRTKKVVAVKQQEATGATYLDHLSLRRTSEPSSGPSPKPCMFLTKPGAEDGHEEEIINFLVIEEALKKGMRINPQPNCPPLSARQVSLPVLSPSGQQAKLVVNNDPFLTLKEDKEEAQDESFYVECEASTALKPSNVLPSPVPEPPVRPSKQTKPQMFPPGPQQGFQESSREGRCQKTRILPEDSGMKNEPWYTGPCDRRVAEAALLRLNKNSVFMVRPSSRHSQNQPFTLAVLYKNHVYNVPIRYLESSRQFALGKEGKGHEETFDSVSSIVQKYSERPLVLVDGSTSAKEQTCLLFPVKP